MHILTKSTVGRSQPQGSNDHMTAANATGSIQKAPNAKQMLTDIQDTNNSLQKNATDHI